MRTITRHKGFTILELMMGVGIVALLAMIAFYGYQRYTQRARAADIVVKVDAIRSGVGADLALNPTASCEQFLGRLSTANLKDDYARLAYGFQATGGGYRPVLTVCASTDKNGPLGVGVARGAHETLERTGLVEKGAVLSETVVSFAVALGDAQKAACTIPYGGPTTPCGDPVAVPTAATMATPGLAPTGAVPTPAQVQAPRCAATAPHQVDRQVMTFGPARTGYVMNSGDLNTGGDMREFTAEVAIVGGQQVAASAGHGATILSYATRSETNEFLIWNPSSLTIEFKGVDINTGINVNDGQNHRITVTWHSDNGALALYDNGRPVWTGVANKGGTIGGNGKVVLGQDQDTYGGGFSTNDAFQGKIVTASLANVAVPGLAIRAGPLQTTLDGNNGLITNVILGPGGTVTDTTGKHTYQSGGSMQSSTEKVDTGLYVTRDCS